MMLPLLRLALSVLPALAAPGAGACKTEADCSYNGRCAPPAPGPGDSSCVCDAAWRGPRCSTLNLQPARRDAGLNTSDAGGPIMSWGGTVNRGDGDGLWHMHAAQFVSAMTHAVYRLAGSVLVSCAAVCCRACLLRAAVPPGPLCCLSAACLLCHVPPQACLPPLSAACCLQCPAVSAPCSPSCLLLDALSLPALPLLVLPAVLCLCLPALLAPACCCVPCRPCALCCCPALACCCRCMLLCLPLLLACCCLAAASCSPLLVSLRVCPCMPLCLPLSCCLLPYDNSNVCSQAQIEYHITRNQLS
eukprot:SAG22_NODE_1830_length_3484_cov_1.448744_1_plen_304_part_00